MFFFYLLSFNYEENYDYDNFMNVSKILNIYILKSIVCEKIRNICIKSF